MPVSAREDLRELLTYGVHGDREAEEAIATFAHELAEEIRRLEPDWDGDEEPWEAWNAAADLTDPEVS